MQLIPNSRTVNQVLKYKKKELFETIIQENNQEVIQAILKVDNLMGVEESIFNYLFNPNSQKQIEYPILAYQSNDPRRNEMMICNLAKNNPQKKFIFDFRVISFVETNSQYMTECAENIEIHFLASDDDLQQIALFKLCVQPWKSEKEDDYSLNEIITKIDIQQHHFDQIQKVCLLKQKKITLVIQVNDRIFLKSEHRDIITVFKNQTDYVMVQLPLICLFDQCYYVRRIPSEGDEIISIKFNEITHSVEEKVKYKQKQNILQMQINPDTIPQTNSQGQLITLNQLLILDSNRTLKLLGYMDNKRKMREEDLIVLKSWDLLNMGFERVFRALEIIPWLQCVLSTEAIQTARTHINDQFDFGVQTQKHNIQSNPAIYSINSKTFKNLSFISQSNKSKEPFKCVDISLIQGVSKVIQQYDEQGYCYFLISQLASTRYVDLMDKTQAKLLKTKTYITKQLVLIAFNSQFLVFTKEFLMLKRIVPFTLINFIENACDDDLIFELAVGTVKSLCHFNEQDNFVHLFDRLEINQAINQQIHDAFAIVLKTSSPAQMSQTFVCINFFKKLPFVFRQLHVQNETKMNEQTINRDFYIMAAHQNTTLKDINVKCEKNNVTVYYFRFSDVTLTEKDTQCLQTSNYVVIGTNEWFWIIDRSAIKKFSTQFVRIEDYKINQSFIKIMHIKDLFYGDLTVESRCRYQVLSHKELAILRNKKLKKNKGENHDSDVIQISFLDMAIAWDLEQNSEIQSIKNISELSSVETYQRTGFNFYTPQQGKKPDQIMREAIFFYSNEDSTLICAPPNNQNVSCIFRTYTALQIYMMQHVETLINAGKNQLTINHLQDSILNMNLGGHTFFSLFYDNQKAIDLACKLIHQTYDGQYDEENNDPIFIRQMFYSICLPFKSGPKQSTEEKVTLKSKFSIFCNKKKQNNELNQQESDDFKHQKISFDVIDRWTFSQSSENNLVQWLIKEDQPQFDELVALIILSKELSLRSLIQEFDDFRNVFDVQCDCINQFMQRAFIQTSMSKGVTTLRWDTSKKSIVFAANTSQYSEDKVRERAEHLLNQHPSFHEKLFGMKQKPFHNVEIRIIEVSWLNGNIPQFYSYLAEQEQPGHFDNELIKVLLEEQNYNAQIIFYLFIPYVCYMSLTLTYFLLYVTSITKQTKYFDINNIFGSLIRLGISFFTLFFLRVEIRQMLFQKTEYLGDIWNFGTLTMLAINQYIVIVHCTNMSVIQEENLVKITSFASMYLWLMFYYWMRLFPQTAFYVKMLAEIVWDLRQFMLFFIMIIATFATAQTILDSYYQALTEVDLLPEQTMQQSLLDNTLENALIANYLLGLGQYNYGNFYLMNYKYIAWIFFLLSSFFTNILFFNMIISIMTDTFDKISQNKLRNGVIQQTQLYSDFISSLKVDQQLDQKRFLYIIKSIQQKNTDDQTQWQGGVVSLKTKLQELNSKITEGQNKLNQFQKQSWKTVMTKLDKLESQQKTILAQVNRDQQRNQNRSDSKQNRNELEISRKFSISKNNYKDSLAPDLGAQISNDNLIGIKKMIQEMNDNMLQKIKEIHSDQNEIQFRMTSKLNTQLLLSQEDQIYPLHKIKNEPRLLPQPTRDTPQSLESSDEDS